MLWTTLLYIICLEEEREESVIIWGISARCVWVTGTLKSSNSKDRREHWHNHEVQIGSSCSPVDHYGSATKNAECGTNVGTGKECPKQPLLRDEWSVLGQQQGLAIRSSRCVSVVRHNLYQHRIHSHHQFGEQQAIRNCTEGNLPIVEGDQCQSTRQPHWR